MANKIIKSIQRGVSTVAEGTTITISEVDMSKTKVNFCGLGAATISSQIMKSAYLYLSSSTSLTGVGSAYSVTISWEVVEYL